MQYSPEWKYTFQKLLKFNEDNQEYEYKVEETGFNGAYNPPVYSPESVSGGAGQTITNTLITRDVTVKKIWNDNDYKSFRYPVTVTLTSDKIKNDPTISIDVDEAGKEKTVNIPIRDTAGNEIIYTPTENIQKYHYNLSCPDSTAENYNSTDGYRTNYTLTNTLPLTAITVNKIWNTGYPENTNKPSTIEVKLTRKSNNGTYSDVTTSETGTYTLTSTASAPYTATHTFSNLLMYDENNELYTYKAEETVVPAGYTVNNPPQEISADTQNKNLQITNITNTGTAEFTKYDSSYNNAYNITDDTKKKVMSGVQFKLYLKNSTDAIKVKLENGKYQPDKNGTNTIITTDEKGKIYLENLTPNSYYLKEVTAPQGYRSNTREYAFTVDSNGETAYNNNITQIDNEEILSTITLTKQDAILNENIPSPATYYLLREIPEGVTGRNVFNPNDNEWKSFNTDNKSWEICETLQTENGMITVDGLIFGTYLFWEVKAPVGYEVNNSNLETITINAEYAGTTHESFSQTRTDPRKSANVKILKTGENGEPLQGAEYELYKQAGDNPDLSEETTDTLKGTYTTNYKGLNENAITLDEWGKYYFKEITSWETAWTDFLRASS